MHLISFIRKKESEWYSTSNSTEELMAEKFSER